MNTGTSLITLDQLDPSEAKLLHLEVKNRGRGEMKKFIKYETNHSQNQYYYRMRKMGVMPLKPNSQNIVEFKSRRNIATDEVSRIDALEAEIKQLKAMLEGNQTTPAQRALALLSSAYGDMNENSRKFLSSLISKNPASLTAKQQKWISDLEMRYL